MPRNKKKQKAAANGTTTAPAETANAPNSGKSALHGDEKRQNSTHNQRGVKPPAAANRAANANAIAVAKLPSDVDPPHNWRVNVGPCRVFLVLLLLAFVGTVVRRTYFPDFV